MTLNKGLLTASIFYFSLCGAPFAQELITVSNEMITRLEIRKPQICRQVLVNERPECEQLFEETIQAIRNKVARFTQGDQAGFKSWIAIETAKLDELGRRYGHLAVSKDLR